MFGHLLENLDYLVFVALAVASFAFICLRLNRLGQHMPRHVWLLYGIVVLLALPITTLVGMRPEHTIRQMLLNVAPLAALQMKLEGHGSVHPGSSAEDPTYRRLVEIQRRFVASTPNIVDFFTAASTPEGRIVYLVHASHGIGAPRERSAEAIRASLASNEVVVESTRRPGEWGGRITALAPIMGSDGRAVAVAGVEFDSSWGGRLRSLYRLSALALLGVTAAVLGLWGHSLAALAAQLASVRLAEGRSREAEARLGRVINTSEDAILITDPSLRLISWNHRAAELFGWSGDEAQGRPLEAVFQPLVESGDYGKNLTVFLRGLELEAPPSRLEFRGRRADGAPLIGELTTAALALGATRSYVLFLRDLTARVRADDEMRELADRLERTQEAGRLGSFELDLTTDRLRVSVQALPIIGFTEAEIATGTALLERIHPEDRIPTQRAFSTARRAGTDLLSEFRLADGRGGFRHVRLRARLRRDSLGRTIALSGTATDITALAQASSEARLGRRQFEDLFESAASALFVVGPDQRVQLANRAALKLLGKSRDELLLQPIDGVLAGAGLLPENHRSVVDLPVGKRLALHRSGAAAEAFVGELWVRDFDTEGGRGLVLQIDDTTERERRLRDDLRTERTNSIGSLAAGIAHELNNALAPIALSTEIIRRRAPEVTAKVDLIDQSVERAARMVSQLLQFVRSAKTEERRTFGLAAVVRDVAKVVEQTFPKNIRLETDLEGASSVRGDPGQLHQAILTLAINARDAMPQGGSLRLSSRCLDLTPAAAAGIPEARAGRFAVLEVTDTGTGIAPEVIDRIFDPFFTTKSREEAIGLGLPTVLSVVRAHDGFIAVQSTPGSGTEFRVYLPIQGEAATSPDSGEATSRPRFADGAGALVLVVDDEAPLRDAVCSLLAGAHYRTETAGDGAEGLTRFLAKQKEVRAVITDLQMPGLDGLWLVQAIRKVSTQVRIIVATGVLAPGQEKALKTAGADAIVTKPFAARALLEAVGSGQKKP